MVCDIEYLKMYSLSLHYLDGATVYLVTFWRHVSILNFKY